MHCVCQTQRKIMEHCDTWQQAQPPVQNGQLSCVLAGMGFFPCTQPGSVTASQSVNHEVVNHEVVNHEVQQLRRNPTQSTVTKRVQFSTHRNHLIVASASILLAILFYRVQQQKDNPHVDALCRPPVLNLTHLLTSTLLAAQISPPQSKCKETLHKPKQWLWLGLRKKLPPSLETWTVNIFMVRDSYLVLDLADSGIRCTSASSTATGYHSDLLLLGSQQEALSRHWQNATVIVNAKYVGSLFQTVMKNPMAKFLSSPLLGKDKDPSDWPLDKFQVFPFQDCKFPFQYCKFVSSLIAFHFVLQQSFQETCTEVQKQQQLLSPRNVYVDDMLLPDKLCTWSNTMSSLLRVANLLEDSVHGQLAVHQYARPFLMHTASFLRHDQHHHSRQSVDIVIVDVSVAVRDAWFLSIGDGRNVMVVIVAHHSDDFIVLFQKHPVLSPQKRKAYKSCACPPAECMCLSPPASHF